MCAGWVLIGRDRLYYASDYFEQLYQYALDLIKSGKAYVCDLSATEVREYRGTLTEPGRESPFRNRSVEENVNLFERMRAGEYEDGSRTLRAKIDMNSPNINMRDPVIYRILRAEHHRTKNDVVYLSHPMTLPTVFLILLRVLPILFVPLNLKITAPFTTGFLKNCISTIPSKLNLPGSISLTP